MHIGAGPGRRPRDQNCCWRSAHTGAVGCERMERVFVPVPIHSLLCTHTDQGHGKEAPSLFLSQPPAHSLTTVYVWGCGTFGRLGLNNSNSNMEKAARVGFEVEKSGGSSSNSEGDDGQEEEGEVEIGLIAAGTTHSVAVGAHVRACVRMCVLASHPFTCYHCCVQTQRAVCG